MALNNSYGLKTVTLRHMSTFVTRAKCKGNYGKRVHWPIGHCKRGERQLVLVFIEFVTMSNPKGKHYILIILDSFSWHFTDIPCARDRVIDATSFFFPPERNTPYSILWLWYTFYRRGWQTILQPNVDYIGISLSLAIREDGRQHYTMENVT